MHITNKISRVFGKFASKEFSPSIQKIINNSYVKLLKLDMGEFKDPVEYKTLNALFTRALLKNREIDTSSDSVISPADSFVSQCGKLEGDTLMQIKGMNYNVKQLLANISDLNLEKISNGNYMNFYLSPKDYHRYHAPTDFKIKKLIHIPAKLYPVNFRYLKKEENLFIKNERVILECITKDDKLFYIVFVGALNVGEMVFHFEPRVESNKKDNVVMSYEYENIEIKKGEELGYFKMGSTLVMIWEKDMVILEDLINKKIKFGDIISNYI